MNPQEQDDLAWEILDAFLQAFDPAVWWMPSMVALIGVTGGIIAAVLLLRARQVDASTLDAEARAADLDKRKATVVEAIRALDLERDKLAPEDYERERRALLAHGAQALRDLEKEGSVTTQDGSDTETLVAALEGARETLGDETVEALKARITTPAPTPPPAPSSAPAWMGGVVALGGVVVIGLMALLVAFVPSGPLEETPTASARPPGRTQAPRGPDLSEEAAPLLAALEADANDIAALNGLTDLEIRRQDWDKAGEYNARALGINAEDAEARTWSALLLYRSGDPITAVKRLDQVITDSPSFGRARQFRGIIHLQIGQFDEAIAQFEGALELAEDDRTRVGLRQLLSEARAAKQAANAPPDLAGTITLAEGIDPSSWGPNATVYVSVKAASGPPMPLRAKKFSAAEFPLSFSLNAADAPMRGGPLPEAISLTVKVDLDGNPMGDDPGAPKTVVADVKPGTSDLTVVLGS